MLVATESWPPNLPVARRNLRPLGVALLAGDEDGLPFRGESFDLVVSGMYRRIRARGPFVSHAQRFLIEARKPR